MVYSSADILGRWGHFLTSKTHFSRFNVDRGLYKDGKGSRKRNQGRGMLSGAREREETENLLVL